MYYKYNIYISGSRNDHKPAPKKQINRGKLSTIRQPNQLQIHITQNENPQPN